MESQRPPAQTELFESEAKMTMEEVVRLENLKRAYRRVRRNDGSPGVDGMGVEELGTEWLRHSKRITQELLEGTYVPQPVLSVEIPKANGGKRQLGIPTVLDRFVQQALLQVLQPEIDPTFSDSSFGYRPKRSAHQAILRAREYMLEGFDWVVDVDLEQFFDQVNHDVLMSRLARRIEDKRILRLIRRYLQADLMKGGLVSPRVKGTPQGGPLSPLLSNVMLDELDRELEERGHFFVRFADDLNVYVRSQRAGERVLTSLERFLTKRLRLRVNRRKSAVDRPWNRKFLGYTVTVGKTLKLSLPKEAQKRFKNKIRGLARRGRGQKLERTILELNRTLRGWLQYYRLVETPTQFSTLDSWIRRRLRCMLWRQWNTAKGRAKNLRRLGIPPHLASRAGWTGYGPWPMSASKVIHTALPNAYFAQQNLYSLRLMHRSLTP